MSTLKWSTTLMKKTANPAFTPASDVPRAKIHRSVWALGFVSMFMDIS